MILGELVTIGNGEARPIGRVWPDGSYECPWCFYGVQADAPGCPNPNCFALIGSSYWTAERIAGAKAIRAAKVAGELIRIRDHKAALERIDTERQARVDKWVVVAAEAARRGSCVACLRASAWDTYGNPWNPPERPDGRAKFVKHRGECPRH